MMDSMILCKFLRGVFVDFHEESAAMLSAVTGWDVSADELRETPKGRQRPQAREHARGMDPRRGHAARPLARRRTRRGQPNALPRARLDAMIAEYYRLRGWDDEGRVP